MSSKTVYNNNNNKWAHWFSNKDDQQTVACFCKTSGCLATNCKTWRDTMCKGRFTEGTTTVIEELFSNSGVKRTKNDWKMKEALEDESVDSYPISESMGRTNNILYKLPVINEKTGNSTGAYVWYILTNSTKPNLYSPRTGFKDTNLEFCYHSTYNKFRMKMDLKERCKEMKVDIKRAIAEHRES
jgi:hypothetical protein